jgi:hypothetical protein
MRRAHDLGLVAGVGAQRRALMELSTPLPT